MTAGTDPCPDCPVSVAEIAAVLMTRVTTPHDPVSVLDDRLNAARCAACEMARDIIDPYDPDNWTWPDPLPAPWREGIIGIALDVYRNAALAMGYFTTDVGIASVGTDVTRRWRSYFVSGKEGWGFA